MADEAQVEMDGHVFKLTNLSKVLYPETGTTKAEVIGYFAEIAHLMLPHVAGRAVTRKRWPDGVAAKPFFHKNADKGTPSWIVLRPIEHSSGTNEYPVIDSPAGMAWLGQNAALEIHVPQWRFGPRGERSDPDRLVFDLDPGEGVALADTAAIARIVRDRLAKDGLQTVAVTSGSKGIHLYAHIENMTSDQASAYAHEIAQELEHKYPDQVLSRMTKALRTEKIFLDWSQNNANKTTIAPYSLRGRDHPMVAAPRFWDELDDPQIAQLDYREVLARIADTSDPMKGLEEGKISRRRPLPGALKAGTPTKPAGKESVRDGADGTDKLAKYRSMRSKDKTPEPVPDAQDNLPKGNDDTFVIQEHHASRLHWDFRLEREGVLVSWALPRGIPTDTRTNHLAVHVEDHPVDYAGFAGTIPKGEYGGGWVIVWDSGRYSTEKWRSGEVIVELHGQKAKGRFALIQTRDNQWLIHRTKGQTDLPEVQALAEPPADLTAVWHSNRSDQQPEPTEQGKPAAKKKAGREEMPDDITPMLATLAGVGDLTSDKTWRLEGKWDGIRAVAYVGNGPLRLISRTGKPFVGYPELAELDDLLAGHQVVLDGEIVALDGRGRSNFGLLQQRMGLTRSADIERAAAQVGIKYFVFDVLFLDGVSLLRKTYDDRRRVLEALGLDGDFVRVPAQLEGSADEALARSKELDWEGILAKTADSVYQPGGRGRTWRKIKNQRAQEVVVVGWKPGSGRRSGGIGSLLLALPSGEHDGAYTYIGKVGTGFTDAMLDDLAAKLLPTERKTPPLDVQIPRADAKDAHWVSPELVGEVTFAEWTRDNLVRQASWRGLRPDKLPAQVRKES